MPGRYNRHGVSRGGGYWINHHVGEGVNWNIKFQGKRIYIQREARLIINNPSMVVFINQLPFLNVLNKMDFR